VAAAHALEGYEMFGEVDWSPEHKRYFLRKRLAPS
jgi:hypothetical protein